MGRFPIFLLPFAVLAVSVGCDGEELTLHQFDCSLTNGSCGSVPPPLPPLVNEVPGPSAALLATPTYSGAVGTVYTCQRNVYVAMGGSDANSGSESSPWRTIQHADATTLRAGDCVNVAAGTYVWKGSFDPKKGGNLASPTGYVTYRCQTLNACLIVYNGPSGGHVWGFTNPYYVVDGFDVDGGEAATYGGLANACFASSIADTGRPGHHIWILNNRIHGCNLGGVVFNDSEYYFTIHNEVFNNAWTSGYQGSGIGYVVAKALGADLNLYRAYTPTAQDSGFAPFHMLVSWNKVHDNGCTTCLGSTLVRTTTGSVHSNTTLDGLANVTGIRPKQLVVGPGIEPMTYVSSVSGSAVTLTRDASITASGGTYTFRTIADGHSDGNGIIMDTWCGMSCGGTGAADYPNETLVSFNDVQNNGGRGIHLFAASHITVANNSMYRNGLDIFVEGYMGEISQQGGVSNNWYNNNAVAVRNLNASCNRTGVTCNYAVIAGNGRGVVDTNIVWQHNIVVGAGGVALFDADKNSWLNANNKANSDPLYVDQVHGNLALQATSPAIGYAFPQSFLPAGTTDAGAYQNGSGERNK